MVVWWSATKSASIFSVMLSVSLFTAVQSDCGVPPSFQFAVMDQKFFGTRRFDAGSVVIYHCEPGYARIPGMSNRITCSEISEWSQLPEFCRRKSCGSPGELLNGRFDLEDALFGSTATFSCNEGYRLVGRAERKCQHDGLWSHSVPTCEPVICQEPPEIVGGTYSGRGKEEYTYQSSVTYHCNEPSLSLIGEPSIFCTEYGKWSGNPPVCRDITCPKPVMENGQIISSFQNLYKYGDTITFRCDYAFIINGSNVAECGVDNKWLPKSPECLRRESCPEPLLENGKINGSRETFKSGLEVGYRIGSSVEFHCDPGFSPVPYPRKTVNCQQDLHWYPKNPTCRARLGCLEPHIANGIVYGGINNRFKYGFQYEYRVNSVVEFSCQPGYILRGEKNSSCQMDKRWSTEIPTCEARESCPEPLLENGKINGSRETFKSGLEVGYRIGSSVEFHCDPGFSLIPNHRKMATCLQDLHWDQKNPTCRARLGCLEPQIANGNVQGGINNRYKYGFEYEYRVNSVVEFSCQPGYILIGEKNSSCQMDKRWSTEIPICEARESCPEPVLHNGRVIGQPEAFKSGLETGYRLGVSVDLECDPGHEIKGETRIKCGADLKWSPSVPTCVRNSCPVPEVENGYINLRNGNFIKSGLGDKYTAFESVTLECYPGYTMNGKRTISCTFELNWEPPVPTCKPLAGFSPPLPPFKNETQEETEDCRKIPGGVTALCEAVDKKTNEICVEAEIESYKTILEMKKLCLEIQKLQLEINKLQDRDIARADVGPGTANIRDSFSSSGSYYICSTKQCHETISSGVAVPGETYVDNSKYLSNTKKCSSHLWANVYLAAFSSYNSFFSLRPGFFLLPLYRQVLVAWADMASRRRRTGDDSRWVAAAAALLCLLNARVQGDCGIPPPIDNANLKDEYIGKTEFPIGSVASYMCDTSKGYGKKPGLSDTITCTEDSTWSVIPEFCELTCDVPTRFDVGQLKDEFAEKNIFPVGTSVSYDCRPGYKPIRGLPTTITCLQNLTWSIIESFCERRSCGSPGELVNGAVELEDNLFGSVATFSCNEGHRLVGRSTRQCLATGSWNNKVPTCEAFICVSPPDIEGGTHSGIGKDQFDYQSSVIYSCNSSLTLIGEASIYCTQYGNWSRMPPKCKAVSCTDPVVQNGRKISGFGHSYKYGHSVQFECNSGFDLVGSDIITCDEDSNWKPPIPACQVAVSCTDPVVQNGRKISGFGHSYKYGHSVQFECNSGFVLVGSDIITCEEDSNWKPPIPACQVAVSCTDPVVQNGRKISGFGHFYKYGHSVQFECNSGFDLVGSDIITCDEDSNWKPPIPACQVAVSCTDPVVQNGRKISGFGHSYKYGHSVQFECNSGFVLVGSDIITCEEDSNWKPPIPACQVVTTTTVVPDVVNERSTTYATQTTHWISSTPTQTTFGIKIQITTVETKSGEDDHDTGGSNAALIVGILVALFCLVVVLAAVCYVCKKKKEGHPCSLQFHCNSAVSSVPTKADKPLMQAGVAETR
ncbi:complement receptor type 2, partial [Microcaecilia unicolor]|uniref:Complement receptor type 2-like n=1 Tax=Microcaecilia unicolor TaxID=1415580 RepID=A0A6P7ZV66_9AMPH